MWTKRTVLKTVAKVFDPLGFLIPIQLKKKFFQKLWKKGLDWDEKLDNIELENWKEIILDLGTVTIERKLVETIPRSKIDLHVFVDASALAYRSEERRVGKECA